jgi:hypothetical protein
LVKVRLLWNRGTRFIDRNARIFRKLYLGMLTEGVQEQVMKYSFNDGSSQDESATGLMLMSLCFATLVFAGMVCNHLISVKQSSRVVVDLKNEIESSGTLLTYVGLLCI